VFLALSAVIIKLAMVAVHSACHRIVHMVICVFGVSDSKTVISVLTAVVCSTSNNR